MKKIGFYFDRYEFEVLLKDGDSIEIIIDKHLNSSKLEDVWVDALQQAKLKFKDVVGIRLLDKYTTSC